MQTIRLVKVVLLTTFLLAISGCELAQRLAEINAPVQDGAILKSGVNTTVHGMEAGAITAPVVKVDPKAVNVTSPLIKVDPITFNAPLVNIPPGAVTFTVEKGAFTMMPGAITVNVLPSKPPAIDVSILVKSLKDNLKPIGDISKLPKEQQDLIISNSTIMHEAIKSILEVIERFNKTYTDQPATPEPVKTPEPEKK